MIVNRVWAMPSIWTFDCKPILKLIQKYLKDGKNWVDPFAGQSKLCEFRNDCETKQPSNLDALEYLKCLPSGKFTGVLFDPPYSVEQCLRRYTPMHNGTAGRTEYWARCKDEIKRVIEPSGYCLSFCWDSSGLGKSRGFDIIEILLVCHGACHNDTICTVERKNPQSEVLSISTKRNEAHPATLATQDFSGCF